MTATQVGNHYGARTSASVYASTVLGDNPSGYWRFEGTLTATDSSPSGADAIYSGGLAGQVTGGLQNSSDTAARFDGTGRVNRAPDTRYAFAGTAPYSIEAWVRPTNVDSYFRMIAQCDNSDPNNRYGWYLWQQSPNGFGFERFVNNSQVGAYDATPLTPGTWTHVVATFDGTTLKVYHDAQLLAQTSNSKTLPNQSCTLNLGSWPNAYDKWFTGDLDEVAIYPTALTATQVTIHYWRRK